MMGYVGIHYLKPKKSCLLPVTLPQQDFTEKHPYPKVFSTFQLLINIKHAKNTFLRKLPTLYQEKNIVCFL